MRGKQDPLEWKLGGDDDIHNGEFRPNVMHNVKYRVEQKKMPLSSEN